MQQLSARSAAVRQWVLQDRQVLAETTPSQNGKVSSSQPASLIMPTASPRMKRQPASSPRMGRPPQQPQTRQPSPDVDQQRMPPQQPQTRQPSPDVDQQRMPPQQPQTRQAPPDMDELRRLAYQQRQQQRRKRVITPKMLKARPIEIKQNVVMRSKHKGSAGSVTSEISHRSDITEKVTNSKERLRRNSNEIERLETLQSMETFESLKEEVENKMAMANTLLAEATEAKRQAQLEIAEERERLKAAEDAREAALAEAQRQSKIAQDEEKRRQEVEQARLLLEEQLKIAADGERQAKMAEAEQRRLLREEENRRKLEDEEKRKAQERAEERIRMLEAEKMRLDQEHKTALAEAQRKALIAQCKEKRRQKVEQDRSQLDEQLRIEVDRQAKIIAAAQKRFFKAPAAEAEQNSIAQKQVAKKIAMLEAEQKRLDQEHKRALEEAQKQAKIAADVEKRRLEVEQNKQMLEKQLRIEVDRHAQIASAEQQRRLEAEEVRLKLEEEAQRQAQIAADEGQKRLEAESRKLELEQEAQKQAQIAAESEKKRWEAERMRLQLEARVLAENTKRDADEETRKWFDIKRMHVGRQAAEAARLKSPVSKEVKKEAFPDTQSCSGFFVSEGVSECSSDEEGEIIRSNSTLKEAVEIELPNSQESTKIGEDIVNDEHLTNSNPSSLVGSTSFDVGRVTVRHEVRRESPSIYSAPAISSSSRREKSTTKTKSFGFKSLWSTNKDPEQEVKAEQADQTASTSAQSCSSSLVGSTSGVTSCESRWVSRTFRELAAEQGNDFLAMDNEALRLLDLACLQAEERAEDTMNEIQSVTSLIEQERHEMEYVNGVVSVGFEEVKEVMDDSGNAEGEVNEEKSKKSRNLFKSLRGEKKSDKAKKGNETDTEQMSVSCSVSRVKELELELLEQSEQIAEKKKEAYNLLTELKSNSSVNQAIQRGPGKASEEKDRMKTSFFPDKISQYTVEEAIEVMPTLSEVDFISVNTPLSIDESAFAHKPNLLQRTGSLIKRNPLSRNESFTKMSKEEKRAFRHGKAMAKVDNRFQEIVEVKSGCDGGDEDGEKPKEASPNVCGGKDDNKMISNDWLNENATFVSENGASFIDSNDPTYDEDVAILVANTSDSTAYEEDNVDEFVVSSSSASQAQFNPPEKFIQIPTKRVPVQRVRSKEIAVQTDGYPMTSPRMMSPRPTNPQLMSPGAMSPRPTNTQKESFFETAALIGSTACMGGGRAILACADTCNESNPDSRVHDAYNRSSSYPGSATASSVNYYDPDSSLASSVNYYNPTSPAASSMFRSGNAAYSKDEEDLVTRAFVNALQRVDSALHLAEEKKALEEEDSKLEYSARRKPRRHSKRQVKFDDIMSVDGRYVSAREQAKRRQERVPRNLALKPRMQTPRGSDQVWREELGSPREQWREELGSPREQWRDELGSPREQWREEISSPREKKKGLGKKMFNGIKKLTKVRIVYDD